MRGGGGVALRDLPGCISLVPLPCPRFDSKGLISVLWAFSRLAVEVLPPPPSSAAHPSSCWSGLSGSRSRFPSITSADLPSSVGGEDATLYFMVEATSRFTDQPDTVGRPEEVPVASDWDDGSLEAEMAGGLQKSLEGPAMGSTWTA